MVALLLGVTGVNAIRKTTTTLWKGTSSAGAEIHLEKSKFTDAEGGDVLRITFSFTTAGSMHLCYKTGEDGDWSAKAFNGISEYPYFTDTSVSSSEFSINATDLTTLQAYGMYIYGFDSSTITKIELIHCSPTHETELFNGSWTASWDPAKMFAPQSSAKIGDVIRFSYSAPGGWSYFQFNILDAYGNADAFENKSSNVGTSMETAANLYFDFEITNISDLKKIQTEGFGIKGDNFTLTSVQLLTYADSYGYTTITIPEVGYATWSSDKKYDFKSADLQAYYASDVAQGSVTLTPMDITWDYQGYIIKGSKGDHDVLESLTTDGSSYYPNTNYLKCNIESAEVYDSEKNRYIFAVKKNDANSVGFYKLTSSYSLAAHRAYLETTDDITTSRVALVFDDGETTGIQELENSSIEELNHSGNEALKAYYNLNGQRVTNPKRGLYIVNGKKVIIK